MKDYRPYVKLYQLSRKYSDKLGKAGTNDKKTILEEINIDFNQSFWHHFKHLYPDLKSVVKEDINNIFHYSGSYSESDVINLSNTLIKAEDDAKKELPEYLSSGVLSLINTD